MAKRADGAWRIVVRSIGGPEALEREHFEPGLPGPGELLIENEAIGLNYIDTYFRSGLYPSPLPFTPGSESVGRVLAVGDGDGRLAPGDRVGVVVGMGGYATHRTIKADTAILLPDDISSEVAAASLLKGLTACYLAEKIVPRGSGDWALVHSAAGGVGSLLVPWLQDRGVRVIAHSTSAAKAATMAAEHVLSCPFGELAANVRALTGGAGVHTVFDGVGRDSWQASLASLRPRGLMVSYGNASDQVPPISLLELMRAGSVMVIRPTLGDFIATPEMQSDVAGLLFDRLRRGIVSARIGQRFALSDVAAAHRALEARQTVGSTVLIP